MCRFFWLRSAIWSCSDFLGFAITDSRPCVVSSAFLGDELLSVTPGILPCAPSGPASPFAPLLRRSACARESNQREHTLGAAPARSAGALRAAGVLLTAHPCAAAE